jgi:DNA repair exonuclease SbcCD ATPase subunit
MKKVSDKNTKDEILAACRELEQACEKLSPWVSFKKASGAATKRELLDSYREMETTYQALLVERKPDKPAASARTPTPPGPPATAESPQPASPQRPPPQRPPSQPAPPKATEKQAAPEEPVMPEPASPPKPRETPPPVAMDSVIAGLNRLGDQFNLALSQLSTQLLAEAGRLREVGQQVAELSEQLARLYQLREVTEEALGRLLAQYDDSLERYGQEKQQRGDELERQWREKSRAWQQEKGDHEQAVAERDADAQRQTAREEQEYRNRLTQERERQAEEWKQQCKQKEQALAEDKEKIAREWAEREKELAEREKQLAELKARVEGFDKELETAVKRAREEGVGAARQQARLKTELAGREFAGEEEVYQIRLTTLEKTVAEQDAQLARLAQQLETVLKQTQELAVKAIEGSSHHASFQALREITLEQAKNPSK